MGLPTGRLGRGTAATVAMLTCLAGTAPALAEWPERPVTLIVIAGAGGGSDYTMRLLARELEAKLGRPFNVVNQPQASGVELCGKVGDGLVRRRPVTRFP